MYVWHASTPRSIDWYGATCAPAQPSIYEAAGICCRACVRLPTLDGRLWNEWFDSRLAPVTITDGLLILIFTEEGRILYGMGLD